MQLVDLNDSKEAIYGALDAWVAWEQNFPIASLKLVLNALEKQQQWHRVVQVSLLPASFLFIFSCIIHVKNQTSLVTKMNMKDRRMQACN